MKKIVVPITLFALAVILFTSCSNSSKLAFSKRHYRSGNFHDVIPKNQTAANISVAALPLKANHISSAAIVSKSAAKPVEASPRLVPMQKNESQKVKHIYSQQVANSIAANQNILLLNADKNVYSGYDEEHEHHEASDADVSFVVIVLCAIFIPPLGVALAYGIDSYFWIDLILTLLFFFPGMIFALIVVLM